MSILRHLACAVSFCIRWGIVLFAIAVCLVCISLGGVAVYVWVTQFGWLPMLITMSLIAGAFVLLICAALFCIWIIEWAEDNANCRNGGTVLTTEVPNRVQIPGAPPYP